MKDASSNPLAFNPNYEEQRKDYLPVQQRNATGKSRKPPVPFANNEHSPESRTASDFEAAPPSGPHQRH